MAKRGGCLHWSLIGLLTGVIGGAVWWWGFANHPTSTIAGLIWSDPCETCSRELEVIFPLFFGPLMATAFSLWLSRGIARWLDAKQRPWPRVTAFVVAVTTYALTTGVLAAVLRLTVTVVWVDWEALEAILKLAAGVTGLYFAGPLAIVSWAFIAGVLHALRQPREAGSLHRPRNLESEASDDA